MKTFSFLLPMFPASTFHHDWTWNSLTHYFDLDYKARPFYPEYNPQHLFIIWKEKKGPKESVLFLPFFYFSFPHHSFLKLFIRCLLSARQLPETQRWIRFNPCPLGTRRLLDKDMACKQMCKLKREVSTMAQMDKSIRGRAGQAGRWGDVWVNFERKLERLSEQGRKENVRKELKVWDDPGCLGNYKQLRIVRSLAMRTVREKWHVFHVKGMSKRLTLSYRHLNFLGREDKRIIIAILEDYSSGKKKKKSMNWGKHGAFRKLSQ